MTTGSAQPVPHVEPSGLRSVVQRGLNTRMWFVTLVCLVIALILVAISLRSGSASITVRFKHGHGIKVGDPLRYRGIDVGQITDLQLDTRMDEVMLTIALDGSSNGLARSGSRFWIERPRFSLGRVSGIDTVVGSKYVAVLPGAADAARETRFVGLESPLMIQDNDVLEIVIRFREGNGIEIGDPLKHRGIVVGEVTSVDLAESLAEIRVHVRLREHARALARTGSQFWVERPKVSLASVRGLETLVGGRYLAVNPGPKLASSIIEFEGLDSPPANEERLEGGLEIILEGDQRHGLEVGAPVTYRGLQIGHVVSLGLSADAAQVETRAYIQPAFKQIVRTNSQFWSTSGIDLSVGLKGIQLSADTLATIAAGGVAVATPNVPGRSVSTGFRFILHRKPENDWLEWRPHLLVSGANLPDGLSIPQPLRVAVRWREKRLAFERNRQRDGWLLLLEDGRLLGPANLFRADREAIANSTVLEVAGNELNLSLVEIKSNGHLVAFQLAGIELPKEKRWPLERVVVATAPEDCLATTGPLGLSLSLPASRLAAVPNGVSTNGDVDVVWNVDAAVSVNEDASGACVIANKSGALVGILAIESGRARVIPISRDLLVNP